MVLRRVVFVGRAFFVWRRASRNPRALFWQRILDTAIVCSPVVTDGLDDVQRHVLRVYLPQYPPRDSGSYLSRIDTLSVFPMS